jgi:protein Tex
MNAPDHASIIARELNLPRAGVARTLELFAGGATLPFVARYRKEQTGDLDEVQLGQIRDRHEYLAELDARKKTILDSIAEQGKLTPELRARIEATLAKTELEDLYLPYKPRRRTRASIARERGLEPLEDEIWAQRATLSQPADALAARFVGGEVPDLAAAWQGARDIVAERIAEDAGVRAALRELFLEAGEISARAIHGKEVEGSKYKDYFEFREPIRTIPSHRTLALRRGEKEGFLRVALEADRDTAIAAVRQLVLRAPRAPLAGQLEAALVDAHDRLLVPSIEVDVRLVLKERADAEAIRVFAENLRHVLLAPPLGGKRVLAIDPGLRTGCKVVALDEKGDLLEETVIFPHEPRRQTAEARQTVASLCGRHRLEAVAVGNGTAGRETHELVTRMKREGELAPTVVTVLVNESGASVYSASEVAREELPDHDLTVRGSVSIGRRLQDPLAELVKVDPKSIGVGQYQHDVHQGQLKKALDGVVESCVNRVGVEVNTASARLLAYVSGIGETLARNIVSHRAASGPFRSRRELREVPRLGPKAFEQAAGFLRIRGAENPLDGSAVHPESYALVERMARDLGVDVSGLVGNSNLVRQIDLTRYVTSEVGEPTLRDIAAELEKPGRDPREGFEEAGFREDVTELEHLEEGMVLAGVVTNVTAFGAFVDVGVHQDGLVHVSELAHRFVKDPAEVVRAGERVKVKVIKLDRERRRIGLSIKQATAAPARPSSPAARPPAPPRGPANAPAGRPTKAPNTPFNSIRIRPR